MRLFRTWASIMAMMPVGGTRVRRSEGGETMKGKGERGSWELVSGRGEGEDG